MPDGLIDPIGDSPEGQARRTSASALLTAHEPALWAMDEAQVVRARLGRERAWAMTVHVLRELEPLKPLLPEHYAPARVAQIQRAAAEVEDRALVLALAELQRASAQAAPAPPKSDRAELAARVRAHDATLSAWALVLLAGQLDAAAVLEDIQRGRGQRDDAEDTLRLVGLLRPRLGGLSGPDALSAADLDQAEADATALLMELDRTTPQHDRTPQDLVNRAYSAWQDAYLTLVRAGRDLAFDAKDALSRFPKPSSTWGQTSSSRTSSSTTPDPDDAG